MEENMSFSKPLFKGFFIAAFPLLIAGCAPPTIQIASWALDGFLYLTSGKSASDHIVSVAARKDCALWRVIKGEEICSNFAPVENDNIFVAMGDDETLTQDGLSTIAERFSAREWAAGCVMATNAKNTTVYRDVQLAELSFGSTVLTPNKKHYNLSSALAETDAASGTAADPALENAVKLAPERAELQGVNISFRDSSNSGLRQLAGLSVADDSLSPAASITKVTSAVSPKISTVDPAVKPAIKPVPDDLSRYLVLGSFSNRLNADAFSRQLGVYKASVVSAQLRGATYYRVFARPSPGESLEGLKSRYSKATGAKSWVASLPEYESSKAAALR